MVLKAHGRRSRWSRCGAAGAVSSCYDLPSSASIPPVSIMNTESSSPPASPPAGQKHRLLPARNRRRRAVRPRFGPRSRAALTRLKNIRRRFPWRRRNWRACTGASQSGRALIAASGAARTWQGCRVGLRRMFHQSSSPTGAKEPSVSRPHGQAARLAHDRGLFGGRCRRRCIRRSAMRRT